MPHVARLHPSAGVKASEIEHMLHPFSLIREKGPNTWQSERVEGMVLVIHRCHVVRQGIPMTNAFRPF